MKIDKQNNTLISLPEIKHKNAKTSQGNREEKILDVNVKISEDGSKVAKFVEIIKQSPGTNQQKLENIKKQIENGTYTMHYEKIADKMLREYLQETIGKNGE